MNVWIKICANTNVEDAMAAVAAGADALGFIFAPSSRRMDAASVGAISEHVPGVARIGVFVNEIPKRIAEIARIARLTGIQLQGTERPEQISEIRELLPSSVRMADREYLNSDRAAALRIIKAVHFHSEFSLDPRKYAETDVDALLLDTYSANQSGGTGKTFDWR